MIYKKVKEITLEKVYQSAAVVAETVMREDIPVDSLCVVNPANLARAANKNRQKHRPEDSSETEFELQFDHIPEGFLQKDTRKDM